MDYRRIMVKGSFKSGLLSLFLIVGWAQADQSISNQTNFQSQSVPSAPGVSQNSPSSSTKTAILKIEGMTCASCLGHIKKALKTTEGVKDAEVSLQTREAQVQYDPAKVSPEFLAITVNSLGYKATVVPSKGSK